MAERSIFYDMWYDFTKTALLFGFMFLYRYRRSGVENIPSEGGVLVLSNHQSHFDPPLVGVASRRRTNTLARKTLFDGNKLFVWLMRSYNAYPIDREGGGLAGIKATLRLLKSGKLVVMFPEGTRTPDGQVKPFQPGFTTLAIRSKATIVPAAMEGAYDVWPKWRKFPRCRGTIHVHFGKPILPEEAKRYNDQELIAEVERRVRECHERLTRRPQFTHRT